MRICLAPLLLLLISSLVACGENPPEPPEADWESPWGRARPSAERAKPPWVDGDLVPVEEQAYVPALLRYLGDERASVRAAAAVCFQHLEYRGKEALGALLAAQEDPYGAVRIEMALALFRITGQAELGCDQLVHVVESGGPELRILAADAIGELGAGAGKAVPALRAVVLGMGAPAGEDVLPILDEEIDLKLAEDRTPASAAAEALEKIGSRGAPAVDALERLRENGSPVEREAAESALRVIQRKGTGAAR